METAKIRGGALTLASPFGLRMWAWAGERFPPVNFLTGFILYFMAITVVRGAQAGGPVPVHALDLIGALALIGQFLLLRVLDEHKDYATDCLNHPERALQRGLISLADLRRVGIASAALGLLFSLYTDHGLGGATLAWFAMATWTWLMAREFFCREWLRARLVLYAFSHMLITPFAVYWTFRLVAPGAAPGCPGTLLISLTLVSGFAFELARKARGPEESATLESYSKVLGAHACGIALIAILSAILLNQLLLLSSMGYRLPPVATSLIGVTYLMAVLAAARYLKAPSQKARKMNEGISALFMLTNYLSIVLCPLIARGGRWS
jgi:4-hydroxybenzoate polyprenyltransferase